MEIFIKSAHSSLEYDHSKMFNELGFDVYGSYVSYNHRPKINGITSLSSDIKYFDLIIFHQYEGCWNEIRDLLNSGKTVVLCSYGQYSDDSYKITSRYCVDFPNLYISAYSVAEYNKYIRYNCPKEKIRLIYFGKWFEDYEDWTGEKQTCYMPCNDIHLRKKECSYELFDIIKKEVPLLLSGAATDKIGGLGLISLDEMKRLFKASSCCLSLGTKPAPLVLTQIEAWSAGCPSVCYDNGCGINLEGLDILLSSDVYKLIDYIKKIIYDPVFKEQRHQSSIKNRERFNMDAIKEKWVSYIEYIMSKKRVFKNIEKI